MLDIRFALPAAVLLVPMLVAVGALLVHARATSTDRRTLGWRLVLVGYLTGLVAVAFFPFQVVIGRYAAQGFAIQPLPLVTADARSFLLNVLMTAPLGFLLPVLDPRLRFGRVVLVGFLVSLGIETTQLVLGTLVGAARSADVNDLIANTAGAALGFAALRMVEPALRRALPRTPVPA